MFTSFLLSPCSFYVNFTYDFFGHFSLCRLVITVVGCIVKILLIPFKYVMGGGRSSGGHCKSRIIWRVSGIALLLTTFIFLQLLDMATPAYRDPYGSRHMELT